MFEELNKCVTKSRLSKEKLLKFQQRYNKNRICLEKLKKVVTKTKVVKEKFLKN